MTMWNSHSTAGPAGVKAEITTFPGANGDEIHAYVATPVTEGPWPGMVLIHHLPGFNELYFEFAERLARHGYEVICPDLYCRTAHGQPDDVFAMVRAKLGVTDASVVADAEAALKWLKARPTNNGKVGIMGSCSGGRHAVLAASLVTGFDAVIDLWGGGVIARPEDATETRPVAPINYTEQLSAPLLGLFGLEDMSPTAAEVDAHEKALVAAGKEYEFHRYADAGHGFMYYNMGMYQVVQAKDGWEKIFAFLADKLATDRG
jgi:carboxymethylenebutenolidase